MPTINYPGTPGTMLYGGRASNIVLPPDDNTPWPTVANELLVSLPSGTQSNYPLQFGRAFPLGAVADTPEVLLDGTPLAAQQADVMTRHTDGSVKFAVISVVLPTIGTTEQTLVIGNKATPPAPTAESIANMLASYDFEATIGIAVGGTPVAGAPVSARAMLQSLTDSALAAETAAGGVNSRYWTVGPVCTTVLLCDHTTKAWDVGTNATKAIRPMFHVQFWPGIGKYHVRHIIEAGDVTKLKDETGIDVTFTTGNAAPVTRLSQSGVALYAATFQTRAYWGGVEVPRCNIQHGRAYMASTKAIPNYNPAITMNASATASWGTDWAGQSKIIGASGHWRKDMAGTGGAFMIGMLPKWDVVALNTGASHMHEISEAHSEMAGSWAMFFREGNSTKTVFASINGDGRVVSKLSRPTQFLSANNSYMNVGTVTADLFTTDGVISTTRNGWGHDDAHQPGAFWWSYLTTGAAIWNEKLLQMAAWSQFLPNAGGTGFDPGQNGGNFTHMVHSGGQGRGYGWVLRNRGRAWWAALDGSPEKSLMDRALHDMIAQRVGVYDLPGVMVGDAVRDAWNSNYTTWYDFGASGRPNALAYIEARGPYLASQISSNTGTLPSNIRTPGNAGEAPWMRNIAAACAHSVNDLGYTDVKPLADFFVKQTMVFATSGAPRWVAYFAIPCTKTDNTFYQSVADLNATWGIDAVNAAYPSGMPVNSSSGFAAGGGPNTWTVVLDTYGAMAAAAIGAANGSPDQAAAWAAVKPWVDNSSYFDHDPTWAIIPRT